MSLARNPRTFDKVRLLLALLPHRSQEFYDRVRTMLEVPLERLWARSGNYAPQQWQEAVAGASRALNQDLSSFLDEPAVVDLEAQIHSQVDHLRTHAPFTLLHNADFRLARLCYAVCRAIKPALVVETGVAYGVTSAFLLQALAANGEGLLHSVDLPPLGQDADSFVGILIPEALRQRWRLHRGPSKRVLPMLLAQLGKIDLFIHDSLHSYANMRWEFGAVAPYLQSPSVLIADDVEGNRAFEEWVQRARPAFSATIYEAEKQGICGLSVFH